MHDDAPAQRPSAPDALHGLHLDMPADAYYADPVPDWSLSASGAGLLLAPSCPARYLHDRNHPRTQTADQEEGTLTHAHILGTGPQVERYPDEVLSKSGTIGTDAARAFAAEVRARGNVPVKAEQHAVIIGIANALHRHPVAGRILTGGHPEATLIWPDEEHGITRRARLDHLPDKPGKRGRMVLADLKTVARENAAHPDEWVRAAAGYGTHRQAAQYCEGVVAVGLAKAAAMVYVVVERVPPFAVSLIQLDGEALEIGRLQMSRAARIFAHCKATGVWPDYAADGIAQVALPRYYVTSAEFELDLPTPDQEYRNV